MLRWRLPVSDVSPAPTTRHTPRTAAERLRERLIFLGEGTADLLDQALREAAAAPLEPLRPERRPALDYLRDELLDAGRHDLLPILVEALAEGGTAQPLSDWDDEHLTEPPSPAVWAGFPATRGGTAQPLDVTRLATALHDADTHTVRSPFCNRTWHYEQAERIAAVYVAGAASERPDPNAMTPEEELDDFGDWAEPEPWTPEETERQFQLRKAEEDRL